jgi:hypothetical protein
MAPSDTGTDNFFYSDAHHYPSDALALVRSDQTLLHPNTSVARKNPSFGRGACAEPEPNLSLLSY